MTPSYPSHLLSPLSSAFVFFFCFFFITHAGVVDYLYYYYFISGVSFSVIPISISFASENRSEWEISVTAHYKLDSPSLQAIYSGHDRCSWAMVNNLYCLLRLKETEGNMRFR